MERNANYDNKSRVIFLIEFQNAFFSLLFHDHTLIKYSITKAVEAKNCTCCSVPWKQDACRNNWNCQNIIYLPSSISDITKRICRSIIRICAFIIIEMQSYRFVKNLALFLRYECILNIYFICSIFSSKIF